MDLLKAIWRILSGISKAITVLVPLVFVGVFLVALSVGVSEGTPAPLPEKAGLLIAPSGTLVESRAPLEPLAVSPLIREVSLIACWWTR